MRPVLLNARAAARPELGGVERWARELAARLPALRPERYVVARPPAALAHRAGHAWEQGWLPLRAARERAALVLSPANLAPLAWPRNVVVLHDAAALRDPGAYAPAYVAWQRRLLPRIAARAVHVVTVSAFSRGELVALLGLAPERITVVPGGVDHERFSPAADAPAARAALGLANPYVLAVASATARKGLAGLGPAARALAREGVDLVVAGGGRPQFRDGGTADGVRRLGHVDDAVLPGLYAGAEAFVLPSRYEGFGLTCLEAMACGTPVVAAARAALPETCGDAALLVDPDDEEALAAALLAATGERRDGLVTAGLTRAAEFGWERTARELDAVVDALL